MNHINRTEFRKALGQFSHAVLNRGFKPLNPDQTVKAAIFRLHCRSAADIKRRAQRRRHASDRIRPGGNMHVQSCLGLSDRQNLQGHLRENPKRAPRAGHQFHEIIAGDILHHPSAIAQHLPRPIHKGHAQRKITRRAHLNTARTRDIGGDHPAKGWLTGCAQNRAMIHRLEGEPLFFGRQNGLNLFNSRARFGH